MFIILLNKKQSMMKIWDYILSRKTNVEVLRRATDVLNVQ